MVRVQTEDFNVGQEYADLLKKNETGAVVMFVGRVRDFAQGDQSFYLQHYPGMTENALNAIEHSAQQRWDLINTTIIHRIGELAVDDQIVMIGVSAAHRGAAFDACEFMIDLLKTKAPFWKKEGSHWVEAKQEDQHIADAWQIK